ncbi:MAG: tetratricopeptide repeat protein [Leptospiraceae bacterium]|nr:tetratricopeptide repeat protein [Leptospiraceae bacterium]
MNKPITLILGLILLTLGFGTGIFVLFTDSGRKFQSSDKREALIEELKEGEELLKQNNLLSNQKALAIFSKLAAKNFGEDFRVKFGLAVSLEKNKDRSLALDLYRELNQFNNISKEQRENLSFQLGNLLLKLNQEEEEGKSHLENVLRTSNNLKLKSKAFTSFGDFYYKRKNLEEARKNYFSAIENDTNNIHARIGLTRTLRGLGRDISVTDIYEAPWELSFESEKDKLKEDSPNRRFGLKHYYSIGKKYFEAKDYRKSNLAFQKALRFATNASTKEKIYYYLAECNFAIGGLDDSLKYIQDVLTNPDPSLDQAAELRRGIIFYERRKYKEAASIFNSVIDNYPSSQFTMRAKEYRKEVLSLIGDKEKYEAPESVKKKEIIEDSEDE